MTPIEKTSIKAKHKSLCTAILTSATALLCFIIILGCSKTEECIGSDCGGVITPSSVINPTQIAGTAIRQKFNGKIDPDQLENYQNQTIPSYIISENGQGNPITDVGATVGRVLFYDKMLSIDNTLSCSSCHQQALAFSDKDILSKGVEGGLTGRHSMRLVNARFSTEKKFFWDERAKSLEEQTTMPIKDHAELGWSGEQGRPGFDQLLTRLSGLAYYKELFTMAFGDPAITEERMQKVLAQFVRSIQSFDSKYDAGYNSNFDNFNEEEKRGHELFLNDPFISNFERIGGGVGCFNCHRPPEFDINPTSGNNGIISVAGQPGEVDVNNTRAPSLRNIANPDGLPNGPMMHDGSVGSFAQLMVEVSTINDDPRNTRLDPIMAPGAKLHINAEESKALIAFLKTLTGTDVYTNKKWSDPFSN